MADSPDPALDRMTEVIRALVEIMGSGRWPAVDFQDERAVLGEGGRGVVGTGEAEGPDRAMRAARRALADVARQRGDGPA